MCNLDTQCYDDPGYTLLLPIYILSVFIIPYIPWIYTVMMSNGIHCCYISIHFIQSALCTLDTHCYDGPGYILLFPIYILSVLIIPCVHWKHTVMMSLVYFLVTNLYSFASYYLYSI